MRTLVLKRYNRAMNQRIIISLLFGLLAFVGVREGAKVVWLNPHERGYDQLAREGFRVTEARVEDRQTYEKWSLYGAAAAALVAVGCTLPRQRQQG